MTLREMLLPSMKHIERMVEHYDIHTKEYPNGATLEVTFDPPVEVATDDETDPRHASPFYQRKRTQEPDDGYSIIGHKRLTEAGVTFSDESGATVIRRGTLKWERTDEWKGKEAVRQL